MPENELFSKLSHLCDLIKRRIEECVADGTIIPEKVEYTFYGVRDFDKNEHRPTYTFQKRLEKDVICDLKDEPAIQDWLDQLPAHEKILSDIERYTKDKQAAKLVLSMFTHNISRFLFQGITDEKLTHYINMFVGDVEGKPKQCCFKIWMNGIHLICGGDTECEWEIRDGLTIRTPIKSDFEFDVEYYSSEPNKRLASSDAILELCCTSQKSGREAEEEIINSVVRLITCFTLFKLGRVYIFKSECYPQSFFWIPFHLPTPLLSTRLFEHDYFYTLSKKEIPQLRDFIKKVEPLLPNKKDGQKSKADGDIPISIAVERFNDALIGLGSIEQQITSSCMCLEALYLDDKPEVSHKLKLRVAKLLGLIGVEPIEVCRDIKHAYNIRSNFIHGSLIKPKTGINPPELAKRTIDYARRSLVINLLAKQLLDEKGKFADGKPLKEGLIRRIDRSMVDQHKCEDLYQELRPFIKLLDKKTASTNNSQSQL